MSAPEIKQNELKSYILAHFDEALEKHWIELYLQPVVRILTGDLCNFEGLSRWNDPVYGLLTPGKFIPILEETRQIHKLDMYLVELICRALRWWLDHGHPTVPISFNLSRLDFEAVDVFATIESLRRKYDVPRDLLRIEITESIIAQKGDQVHEVLDKLRSSGYEVWMDDFGSGYSSLNILNEVDADLLKLDRAFLRNFTAKSRKIVVSIINMAKRLDMRTLAEGVETEEQLDFLRHIGCDRAQGYLFSQPLPPLEVMEKMKAQGRKIEIRKWRYYYDVAGNAIRETYRPRALLEFNGKTCHFLQANDKFMEQQRTMGSTTLQQVEDKVNDATRKPLHHDFQCYLNRIRNLREMEDFTYSSGNNYILIHAWFLTEMGEKTLYHVELQNITRNTERLEQVRLDSSLRSIYFFFDAVNLFDLETGTVEPLFVHGGQFQGILAGNPSIPQVVERFADTLVQREDQERYRVFADPDTILKRLKTSSQGILADCFRVRNRDGSYTWKEVSILLVPESEGHHILTTLRDIPYGNNQQPADPVVLPARIVSAAGLWEQLLRNTPFFYFWKDRQRRFLGASQSFLDVYGFKSVQDILGKTDEDMGWHVEGEPYRDDEWAVLREGKSFRNVPGQCIIQGQLQHIACSKWPVYEDGRIVGLMGMFFQVDELDKQKDSVLHQSYQDRVTGLMNLHGFVDAMLTYEERWTAQQQPYGIILCQDRNYQVMLDSYGEELGRKLLQKQAFVLRQLFGNRAVLARLGQSRFGMVLEAKDRQALEKQVQLLVRRMDDIHTVLGNEVTVDVEAVTAHSSEKGVAGDLLYQVAKNRLAEKQ